MHIIGLKYNNNDWLYSILTIRQIQKFTSQDGKKICVYDKRDLKENLNINQNSEW